MRQGNSCTNRAPASAGALFVLALLLWVGAATGCSSNRQPSTAPPPYTGVRAEAFMDTLQERTFRWFWDVTNAQNGLVPDRWPTPSFSSIAAVGFGITAYPVGVERGWVTRAQAAERTLITLRFLYQLPQGSQATGVGGYQGFFYHFVDMQSGLRFEQVELSTIDTALLLAGALFCQSYFDGADATEAAVRAYADSLYRRVNWQWARPNPPAVSLGWHPESGFIPYDWRGYNESMILYILALGSPTYPLGRDAWDEWTSRYEWGTFYGHAHVGFAPLFGHQYSHVWVDFRGIFDQYMQGRGIDYFENSRRATLAQREYAIRNPQGWRGYDALFWGLTAADGPADTILHIAGRDRRFYSYAARGASFNEVRDDGTLVPTAAGGSVPFAPEITIPTLIAMRERYGDDLFGTYGFLDSFNPTFLRTDVPLKHGRVVPGVAWFDTDYLGIDQGPILLMIENHRTELIWRVMRRNPYIIDGLRRAGFTGGWLE
jgi:hypothetical protein